MASIRKRIKANGDIVFDSSITVKKHGVIVHRESKTFNRKKIAKDWGMRREIELQNMSVYKQTEYYPIRRVIDDYIKEFNPTGRSKLFDLIKLKKRDIAQLDVNTLNEKDLIRHISDRNKECLPQTAGNDLIWLKTVIKTMKGVNNITLDLTIFDTARMVLRKEGLIAKPKHRERRPTKTEMWQLSRFFNNTYMLHVMWFAIYSARRQNEITRLRWDDLDHNNKTIIVRDIKHPTIKNLRKKAKLPKSAYKIIQRQAEEGPFIFPYNSRTISSNFTRACKMLDIRDLRFHDLRHHAVSILAEKNLNMMQLKLVSLHSDYSMLARYINLKPEDLDI